MNKAAALFVVVLGLGLYAGTQENPDSFTLHVTHVKFDYVGDKPTTQDCAKMPCITMIVTTDAYSDHVSFVLECRQWILIGKEMQSGKCRALRAGKDYMVKRNGRSILFFDDREGQTDPLFLVIEETERGTKSKPSTVQ